MMGEDLQDHVFSNHVKCLSFEEEQQIKRQNARLVSEHQANLLELNAKKHWDLFYKRNETKFFKDRHWTKREFEELTSEHGESTTRVLVEVGCGVGNLVYPLLEDGLANYFFYACDFSPRAVEFVKSNKLYDENKIKAFQTDITTCDVFNHVPRAGADVVTMIFILSAVHPGKFNVCVKNAFDLLKSGGIVLFRDYGRHDMAQLRFKAGNKISENLYMRQDGTRSYFFSVDELANLFVKNGFEVVTNSYVQRRTINVKEKIDVPRIFLQSKFKKPL